MRIVRFRHKDNRIPPLLKELARENRADTGFIFDLFALFAYRGAGIPTEKRLEKIIDRYHKQVKIAKVSAQIIAKKRRSELRTISANVLFKGLSCRPDKIAALRQYLTHMADYQRKMRQAQCLSCNLRGDCEFGTQYSGQVSDITKVLDEDYVKKVHDDCPVRPEIDFANRLAATALNMAKMFDTENAANAMGATKNQTGAKQGLKAAQELSEDAKEAADDAEVDSDDSEPMALSDDSADNCGGNEVMPHWAHKLNQGGKFDQFDANFTGNMFNVAQTFISQLSSANLVLYELGRKFSLALTAQKKGKFKPVPNVSKTTKTRNMETASDIAKIESSQHGLPSEVFDAREDRKELTKIQHTEPDEKKQLLYILIDVSGSMQGQLPDKSGRGLISRSALCATFSIALTERVEDDKGIVFLRFFAGAPGARASATKKEEFDDMRKRIALASFNGGGTDILAALQIAVDDISRANKQEELASAEILCITDCEDYFDEAAISAVIKDVEFNVLDVSGHDFDPKSTSGALQRLATKYLKVNNVGNMDINKIVELV